jgi:hypothetical protein
MTAASTSVFFWTWEIYMPDRSTGNVFNGGAKKSFRHIYHAEAIISKEFRRHPQFSNKVARYFKIPGFTAPQNSDNGANLLGRNKRF